MGMNPVKSSLNPAATMRPDRYRELKKIVREGLTTFIGVGLALIEIREGQGYRYDQYKTFESFLDGEFDLKRSRGYQLMDGGRLSTIVDKAGLPVPPFEGQARELTPLLPRAPWVDPRGGPEWRPETDQHLVDTWEFVTEEYGGEGQEPVTAKIVKRWVRHKLAEIRPEQSAPALPVGVFSTIVADPPWPIQKIARDERPNQHNIDYPTMTVDELMDMAPEVMSRSADDAHLYLWTTHKHLPNALRLAEAWGFKYQCLMTWVKNVGITPFSWMYSTEHVLFCRRGNLELERLGLRLDFAAKVTKHSAKPDEFYDLVRKVSPGPRLEMFARSTREGFDSWGNDESLAN